jgi:signal transduction histidine kinase
MRSRLRLTAVFVLLFVGIALAGRLFYGRQERAVRLRMEREVETISELKRGVVVAWRDERRADGLFFANAGQFVAAANRLKGKRALPADSATLADWFAPLLRNHDYSTIALLDSNLTPLWHSGRGARDLAPTARTFCAEARLSGDVSFSRIYSNGHAEAEMVMAVPLTRQIRQPDQVPLAVFTIDPSLRLFPSLSRETPGSTPTVSYLLRREEDSLVLLNPIPGEGEALRTRFPIRDGESFIDKVAIGRDAAFWADDLHEHPVVASVEPIPESHWLLVVTARADQVYAELRTDLWLTGLLVTLLSLAAVTSVVFFWRAQQLRNTLLLSTSEANRELLATRLDHLARQSAQDLLEARIRLEKILETVPNGILLIEPDGSLSFANSTGIRLLQLERHPGTDTFAFPRHAVLVTKQEVDSFAKFIATYILGEGGVATDLPLTVDFPDGHRLFLTVNSAPIFKQSGELAAVVASLVDMTAWTHAQKALELSRNQLKAVAASLQTAREDERASIAREIHDESGQLMTALKMDLAFLEREMTPHLTVDTRREFTGLLDGIGSLIDRILGSLRRIIRKLRPEILDTLGLLPALEWLAEDFQRRTSIRCLVEGDTLPANIGNVLSTTLFRIFQETLTNAHRHGGAHTVRARLEYRDSFITLTVSDDGRGFDTNRTAPAGAVGLLGMRERAEALGGSFSIFSTPGSGTTIVARFPAEEQFVQHPIPEVRA